MLRILISVLIGSALVAADITIDVSDVQPLEYDFSGSVSSPMELLNASCPEELDSENPYRAEVLMSSFAQFSDPAQDTGEEFPQDIFPSSDGVVRGAIEAWAQHQHLVLRPDEIWFEILAQLNMYMTLHAEEVRDQFVDHEGREEIVVWEHTWHDVVARLADEIQSRVRTDWLLEWIMPGFTTSTENDEMTATVLMMGLMQRYFEYSGGIICGLPSVTLLGEREDWVNLLAKLDRLPEFGEEPTVYAGNLRPILQRFVQTWDEPDSEATRSFWTQIVRADRHFTCGQGAVEWDLSGWITGFLHWRTDGTLRVEPEEAEAFRENTDAVRLGNVVYVPEPLEDLPVGYAKVPMRMLDYPDQGTATTAFLLAGNVAVRRSRADDGFVTAQPMSAWFMYAPVDSNFTTGPPYGNQYALQDIADAFGVCRA